jgi:flagellar motor protein MotB
MKDILKYVPGFRTDKKRNKIIATVYYVFCLLMLTTGIGAFLTSVSVPFIIFSIISVVKHRNKEAILTLIGAILIFSIGSTLNGSTPENKTEADTKDVVATKAVAPTVKEKTAEEIKKEADDKAKADAEAKVVLDKMAKEDAAAKVIADAEAEIRNALIQPGMYKVGTDIKAGEYVVVSDQMAYMQVSKDSTGSFESIIANENIENRTIITIKDGQYFEVKSGDIYPISKAPKVVPNDNQLPAGMYKVGLDVQPGEYKIASEANGYVEVSSNSSHSMQGIVSNDNFTGEKYVTLKQGQYIKLGNATLKLK